MKRINIVNTDLELSAIGLGTVNAGLSWDHEDAFKIFDDFLEAGGNLIDTAHVYSDWVPGEIARSERVVGDWIRYRKRRGDIVLMTKGGHPRGDSMHISRLSKKEMSEDLESSLKQLGVCCIDIYFYHRDDKDRSVEELIETMEDFKKAGKIRYYGCSNWTTERMKEADQYSRKKGYRGFVANQAMFNMGVRHMKPYPDPTMVVCDEGMLNYHKTSENILMPYMGICSGFFHLLKSNGKEAVKDSCFYTDDNLKAAKELFELCERNRYTITQALLGFFSVQDFSALPLAGVDNCGQLAELNKTLCTEFNKEDYHKIL